ncbi:hypothetical protein [Streptococcus equinus]|uniref:hypothetical protein n=1 Tax=Streptococcus equinus TaxID=1335 RepID=UPI0008876782|nr:hypothetical protein [Streptococcus equinus]QBX24689.1 hypothetical protein Javan202_0010 [Streptococcus phage Javan202]SDQ66183.1 hypothetical protein SAMN04488495_1772 [Streptococcus equinus]SEN67231.1 hypothetical protein SAMN04488496_0860 [Streptococcus equinus]
MIRADVAIAEQRQIIDVPVETKSEAIRVLWNTYGPAIDIKRWVEDEQEEVKDDQVDSNESDDSGEPSGEGD